MKEKSVNSKNFLDIPPNPLYIVGRGKEGVEMVNRYPGKCSCGKRVGAGAGTAIRVDGRWRVRCVACLVPEAPSSNNGRRAIEADGTVWIPYSDSPEQRSLLRSFPMPHGTRSPWDAEKKVWRASVERGDLKRTLELARRLGLDIAPELVVREEERTDEAKAAADIPGLYPFQVDGVEFLASGDRRLLADDQGCVSGSVKIHVNRAGKGFEVYLADAYERFNGLSRANWNWDPRIPTYCRALCDGELRQHRVRKILYKGHKPVVRVDMKSGKHVLVTPDHEIARPCGRWTEARKLRPGDRVLTNGRVVAAACPRCGSTVDIITYEYAKFRGYCRKCMYRKLRVQGNYKTGKYLDKDG